MSVVALAMDAVDGWVARRTDTEAHAVPASTWRSTPASSSCSALRRAVRRTLGARHRVGALRHARGERLVPWLRVTGERACGARRRRDAGDRADACGGRVRPAPVPVGRAGCRPRAARPLLRHGGLGTAVAGARRPGVAQCAAGRCVDTTALAFALVWFALVAPNKLGELTPAAFARIPIEGLLLVAVVLVLPQRAARVLAAVVGVVLAVLSVVKVLDMGFFEPSTGPSIPSTTGDTSAPRSACSAIGRAALGGAAEVGGSAARDRTARPHPAFGRPADPATRFTAARRRNQSVGAGRCLAVARVPGPVRERRPRWRRSARPVSRTTK